MDGLCLVVTRRWRFVTPGRTFYFPGDARLEWKRGGVGEAPRGRSARRDEEGALSVGEASSSRRARAAVPAGVAPAAPAEYAVRQGHGSQSSQATHEDQAPTAAPRLL